MMRLPRGRLGYTGALLLLMSALATASDFNYTVPSFCEGFRYYFENDAVSLECDFTTVGYTDGFLEIPSWKTTYLIVSCLVNSVYRHDLLPGTFNHLHELKLLNLKGCQIDVIRTRAFQGLNSLKTLIIFDASHPEMFPSNPRFHPRFEKVFNDTPNLSIIDLENNALIDASIPRDLFCPLKGLRALNLGVNFISGSSHFGLFCPAKKGIYPLKNLINLVLRQNYVRKLHPEAFMFTENLTSLDISGSGLTELPEETIKNLRHLSHLNLSSNSLYHVPAFKHNKELINLTLDNNRIIALESDTFSSLHRLVLLNLKLNQVSALPAGVFKDLQALVYLDLSFNQIENIHNETFMQLHRLKRLYLRGNQIQNFDDGTFISLGKLLLLDLHGNKFESIARETFTGLKNLRLLYISNNNLTDGHGVVSLVPMVGMLFISNNNLYILPSSIVGRSNLQYLLLDHNKIVSIYADDLRGTNLILLDLAHNQLVSLSSFLFRYARKLQILFLNNNLIKHIDRTTFYGLKRLRKLSLRNNYIEDISNLFSRLMSLELLDLSCNKITKLYKADFPNSLKILGFGDNSIKYIESFTFRDMPHLIFVNLTNNVMRQLDGDIFTVSKRPVSKRPRFYLAGMRVFKTCDCKSHWLIQNTPRLDLTQYPLIADKIYLYCFTMHTPRRLLYIPSSKPEDFVCPDVEDCPLNCTCFHTYDWDRRQVYCQSKDFNFIPKMDKRTSHLYLQQNELHVIKPRDVSELFLLKSLHLEQSEIRLITGGAFANLSSLEILFLQENHLQNIASDFFRDMVNLRILRLDGNQIVNIPGNSFHALVSLETLTLHNNNLVQLDEETLGDSLILPKLRNTTLRGNPWRCNCLESVSFQRWLIRMLRKISDANSIKCDPPFVSETWRGNLTFPADTPIIKMNLTECGERQIINQIRHTPRGHVILISTLACAFVFMCFISLVVYRCKELLKVWIFSRYGLRLRPPVEDADKRYDAFISYSSKDEDFLAGQLLPKLEAGPKKYRLCVHYRDWPVGASIAESIITSVESSKRTIILLSNNFLDSEWCFCEFKTAHHKLLQDRTNRVIIILLDDISSKNMDADMKLYMKSKTFLKFKERWFWEKLAYFMPEVTEKEQAQAEELELHG